ncbi:MAG TPA: hypothetical protein VGJ81_00055 [Thermoanaerobaculia bacterium]|jgi:hypothetical protein
MAGRGLVAYGDVVSGTVAIRETLAIPLNSSISISPEIRSVETVDGTPTGSHVALLISSSDEIDVALLEALDFADEVLEVVPPEADPGTATFDEAVAKLRDLLVTIGWPTTVTWVANADVIAFPKRTYLFRPRAGQPSIESARQTFEAALRDFIAVRIAAIGHRKGVTFATVWPIKELGQGEDMFAERRVKVTAASVPPLVITVRFRWRWSLLRWAYEAWRGTTPAGLPAPHRGS